MYANHFFRTLGMGGLALCATLMTAILLQATIVSSANASEATAQRSISP